MKYIIIKEFILSMSLMQSNKVVNIYLTVRKCQALCNLPIL